jgi:hypothetical protein
MGALQERGYNIDYIEITGRPNAEVLEELELCDFIIDEIYSDTPMAVFATEAAFAGKPAVVGSYYADAIGQDLDEGLTPPSAFCHPRDLERTIVDLIENPERRKELGAKAKDFVLHRWAATKVAERYLAVIDGPIPSHWYHDPRRIRYIHGCGLPEEKARRLLRRFTSIGGIGALCVADKPDLQDLLVRFGNGSTAA